MADVEMMQEDEAPGGPAVRGGLNPEASRLFRVLKTVAGMLEKRGYMIPRELREMTPDEFVAKYGEYPSREGLTILVVSLVGTNVESKICVLACHANRMLLLVCVCNHYRKRRTMTRISCLCSFQRTKRSASSPSRSTRIE